MSELGIKAKTQAEIDEFNRWQLQNKNKKKQNEKQLNTVFAN